MIWNLFVSHVFELLKSSSDNKKVTTISGQMLKKKTCKKEHFSQLMNVKHQNGCHKNIAHCNTV
jgi:hypothetical protein